MQIAKLQNRVKPLPQPITATYCNTFWSRFRGLMLRPPLGTYQGLILVNPTDTRLDAAIHMLFMNFDIAAIWVNSQFCVVDAKLAKRWHPVYLPQAAGRFVLELHPSQLSNFKIGDLVEIANA